MPPIDGPFVTPGGSAGCAASAAAAQTRTEAINGLLCMRATIHGTMRPTHEPKRPSPPDPDDGVGVLHLGSLVPAHLRLPPQRRLLAGGADLDPQRLPGLGDHRDVLQQ